MASDPRRNTNQEFRTEFLDRPVGRCPRRLDRRPCRPRAMVSSRSGSETKRRSTTPLASTVRTPLHTPCNIGPSAF